MQFQNYITKTSYTQAQKMKFSIKNFFSKCDQIRSFYSFRAVKFFEILLPKLITFITITLITQHNWIADTVLS